MGLLGGTAAGLVLGVPGLSTAANDGAGESPAAALVQQVGDPVDQDEPADPDAPADPDVTPADDETAEDRPDPGDRLRTALDPLVEDGTISAEQADAVADHLIENRPDRRQDGPRHRHGPRGRFRAGNVEIVTETLGIDVDTLREQLGAGSSLAEIAEANGVDPQTLVDALVADARQKLADAVERGRIDEERADELGERIEERVTDRVNRSRDD